MAASGARARQPGQEGGLTKGFLLKSLQRGEETFRYVLYVPAAYDGTKPWPTILFLHGAGECGSDGLKQVGEGIGAAIMAHAERWPFLVLMPQKPLVAIPWAHYDPELQEILAVTRRDYRVDENRIYLTGLSQGGFGTWALGAKHPDLFAAIAPICGGGNAATASALKTMPIWAFHGDADDTVKPELSREMVEAVKSAGGDATLTLYTGVGHNSWDKAYGESGLWDWLLKYSREAKPSP
jgi:predicted peptidase